MSGPRGQKLIGAPLKESALKDREPAMDWSRRQAFVKMAGAALGFALLGAPIRAFAQAESVLPPSPMRLSRRLDRTLTGGNMLTVWRSWEVDFARQSRGIVITGRQLNARVTAPAGLEALTQLEESRSTADMWPILLSERGRILAAGGSGNDADLAAAIEIARELIEARDLSESAEISQLAILNEMQQASATLFDSLPDDLFYPTGEPVRSVQSIELPNGLSGEFEVTYDAEFAENGGWLVRAVREVITRIGITEKRAREEWVLSE